MERCTWICAFIVLHGASAAHGDTHKLAESVRAAESKRIAVIEKVKPAVIAVFAPGGQGGGSGVLITKDGYALTNFHVVQGSGPVMQCGLPDGVLYDAVLVGLDKVGDIALIKLLPQKEGKDFPHVKLGDSDKVKAGDWCLAMGNPFLLATDFTPTVSYGMVSGVHRYQYPEGSKGLLEYTDCIQVDASINPGNSGGPLFDIEGELIGINGRISLEKRGRVNSGVGYAISINQIKNFMGHLRAGLDADHASLGAYVESKEDATAGMIVTKIIDGCDAQRRGLDLKDEIVSFAGRPVTNQNHFLNVLGLFPKEWRLPLIYRHENTKHEVLVRLMGVQREEGDDNQARPPRPGPQNRPAPAPRSDSPAKKLFISKAGYANYYFNKLETDRIWHGLLQLGDFSSYGGGWKITGELLRKQAKVPATIFIDEEADTGRKDLHTVVRMSIGGFEYKLDPLRPGESLDDLRAPKDSGGLLVGFYQFRRLLTLGQKGFERKFSHGGMEPFYPIPLEGTVPSSVADLRVDTEVLATEHAGTACKWHLSMKDQRLLGFEVWPVQNEDPCEIYLSEYRKTAGGMLPYRFEVRSGDERFGLLQVHSYDLLKSATATEKEKN
jgi:S1-C subfamily serine protease